MWVIFAFGSAVFAGLTAILAKCGIKNTDSNVATALRTIVVLAFSWIMVFVAGAQTGIHSVSPRVLLFLVLSGLATGASWLCYFRALQIGDVNKVTPIDKSSTILTMLLAFVFLGEKITIVKAAAMLLIGVGTYLMIQKKQTKQPVTNQNPQSEVKQDSKQDSQQGSKQDFQQNSKQISSEGYLKNRWFLYACGSAVFASLTSILGKIGIENIDSTLGTAIRTIVVLIMAWIVVFVTKKQDTIRHIDRQSWVFLGLSGIATGASWLCYYRALQTGPASVVVPIDKLSILVTILFSYIVFKEKLSLKSGAGLILIVAGTLSLLI
jgi:transporter family protein